MSADGPDLRFTKLGDYVVARVAGAEAANFLQGQLCGDVDALSAGEAMITAATNAKGRVIAVIRVLRTSEHFELVLPASLGTQFAKRLQMFVLRAKVDIIAPETAETVFAIWSAETQLDRESWRSAGNAESESFLLPGNTILTSVRDADDFPPVVAAGPIREAGTEDWRAHETRAGIPEVGPATTESFIPQMLNLDLIGGVSFQKGCYVGQEVIARAHHLGKVKRRSRLFVAPTTEGLSAGQSVYSGGRAAGKIARVAQEKDSCLLLIVTALADGLQLDAEGAIPLTPLTLPYSVTQ